MKKSLSILGFLFLSIVTIAQVATVSVTNEPVTGTVAVDGTVDITLNFENIGNRDLEWTVGIGDMTTFTKLDFANPDLEENQDRISDNVWLTRGDNQGPYNAAVSGESWNYDDTPTGTLWAVGTTPTHTVGDYQPYWANILTLSPRARDNPGRIFSMYIPEKERFFDIEYTSWTQSNNGGGLSYIRTEFFTGFDETMSVSGTTLPTGNSDVLVNFDATGLVAGDYRGVIRVESNDPDNPAVFVEALVTVTGGVSELTTNSSFDFGDYFINATTTQTIAIENTGTGFLNISDITSDNAVFVPVVTTAIISPGDSYDLEVTFTPTALQAEAGTLSIVSDDPASPFNIAVTGTGNNPPEIALGATSFTESLVAGATNNQLLNISNTGDFDLEYSVTLDLGMSAPVPMKKVFHADWTLPENYDRIGADVWIARAEGTGFFNIHDETFHEDDQTAPLGTEWTWTPTLEATSGDYDATFSSPPNEEWADFFDFTHSLHLLSEDRYFDLSYTSFNYSSTDSYGGAFAYERKEIYHWLKLTDSTEPFTYSSTVTPGNNADVTLMFKTDGMADGQYSGALTITTNIPGSTPIEIPLDLTVSGNTAEASIHEADLAFSDTGTDATTSEVFRIVNNGIAPLSISDITSDNASFILNNTTLTIEPMSHAMIEVDFSPSSIQAHPGTITVTTDDVLNPTLTIPVTGNGIDVNEIDVTDNGLLQVTVQTGNTDTRTLNIANTGVSDLSWSLRSVNDGATEFSFTKENFTDAALAENQDRITDNVWITRINATGSGHGGVFNAVDENSGQGPGNGPPSNTEWKGENTLGSNSYSSWGNDIDPHEQRGVTQAMYLTEDGLYYDVIFHEWGNMGAGGFSYTRWETPGWLKADMISGTTIGAANTDITLTFDPQDMLAGTYLANIVLTSNDADEQEIIIPVELVVTGIPVLVTDLGNSVNIDPAYVGVSQGGPITISNTGTDDLIITDIVGSTSEVMIDATTATIAPGDSFELNGTITPSTTGAFSETLTITSNDGAVPGTDYIITFDGTVLDAPDITVTPTSFDKDIVTGATDTQDITITNNGTGTLNWNLSNVPAWITPSLSANALAPAGSDVVTLTIDLTADAEGVYESLISVDSDDPDSPSIEIDGYVEYGGVLVTSPLADILVNEGFSAQDVDFSSVFTHLNPLTYIIATSDAGVVTASESSTELITITESGTGSSFITIRADDGGSVAYADFTFRVNDIPDLTGAVADITVDEGFGTQDVDLAAFFIDTDTEDSPTFIATSGTTTVVTTAVTDATLTVSEVGLGSSLISIDIDDNSGGTNSDNVTFRVNDIPNLDNALADINAVRDEATQDVDLSAVFSDSDGDALTYSAMSSDPAVATVSITGTTLSMTEVDLGNTTITVTVDDGVTAATLPTDDFIFTIACSTVVPTITTTGVDDESDEFILTSSSATGNQWFLDGVAISGATSQTYSVSEAGSFSVQVSSAAGDCISGMSDPVAVTGVSDVGLTTISIWPNPVQSNLTLSGLGIKDYRVFDTQGKEVILQQNTQVENGVYNLDVSGLRKGIYILKISTDSGSEHQMRFVKD